MPDKPHNAADPVAVKEARRKQDEAEKRERDDVLAVLGTVEGRRFVWRLLGVCRLYESPMHSNGTIQSMNIGRGDVGRELLAWMNQAKPTAYPEMMLEMARKD